MHVQQQVLHVDAGQRVEGAEGLVEQQHAGGAGERSGQRDALRHAARNFLGTVVGVLAQADQAQQAGHGRLALGLLGALRQAERHVVGDGAPGEQARLLKTNGHAGVEPGHGLLADAHGAGGDAVQACGCTQEGGLAASRGANHRDNFAGFGGEGDLAQNLVGSAGYSKGLANGIEDEGHCGTGYGVSVR